MSWQGTWGHLTAALKVTRDSTASGEMRSHLPFLQELALQSKTEEKLYPELKGATLAETEAQERADIHRWSTSDSPGQSRFQTQPRTSQPVTVST